MIISCKVFGIEYDISQTTPLKISTLLTKLHRAAELSNEHNNHHR
jgi:hypothetical protein